MHQLNSILLCCSDDCFSFKDLTQIIISIGTLAIAILTYKLAEKISFKKTVKDRQFEEVCKFINDFSATLITISYQKKDGNGGVSSMYLPHFRSTNFKNENADIFQCANLLVQEDGFNNFNFMHLIGNPFLPRELSAELRKLWFHTEKQVKDPMDLGEYVVISNLQNLEKDNYSKPKGNEFKDFEAFFNFINNIMYVTNNWLDKHEASDIKFEV